MIGKLGFIGIAFTDRIGAWKLPDEFCRGFGVAVADFDIEGVAHHVQVLSRLDRAFFYCHRSRARGGVGIVDGEGVGIGAVGDPRGGDRPKRQRKEIRHGFHIGDKP